MSSSQYHHLLPLTRAVWRLSLFCPFMIDRHASPRYHAPSSRPGHACSTYLKSESCDIRGLQDRRPIQSKSNTAVPRNNKGMAHAPMQPPQLKNQIDHMWSSDPCLPGSQTFIVRRLIAGFSAVEDRKIGAISFFDQVVCAISRKKSSRICEL